MEYLMQIDEPVTDQGRRLQALCLVASTIAKGEVISEQDAEFVLNLCTPVFNHSMPAHRQILLRGMLAGENAALISLGQVLMMSMAMAKGV